MLKGFRAAHAVDDVAHWLGYGDACDYLSACEASPDAVMKRIARRVA